MAAMRNASSGGKKMTLYITENTDFHRETWWWQHHTAGLPFSTVTGKLIKDAWSDTKSNTCIKPETGSEGYLPAEWPV